MSHRNDDRTLGEVLERLGAILFGASPFLAVWALYLLVVAPRPPAGSWIFEPAGLIGLVLVSYLASPPTVLIAARRWRLAQTWQRVPRPSVRRRTPRLDRRIPAYSSQP